MARIITVDFTGVPSQQPNAGSTASGTGTEICLRPLTAYEPHKVVWEWEPYIPKGMITMMTGDPGSLKSYLALSICAQVTTGVGLHECATVPGNCLYLTNENDPHTVIRPRFDSLGGDCRRLFLLDGTKKDGKDHQLTLTDLSMLSGMLRKIHCRVLVVDPIQSFLGSGVDAWRSNQTRPVLDGLVRLTREHNVSTIVIRHARKSGGARAIHRGLDSIDFTGVARSELLVGCSADGKERAMIHIKSNVGPMGPPQAFEIRPGGTTGYFSLLGNSHLTAADLSAPEKGKDTALGEAQEFLSEMLMEGELPFLEIDKERKIRGIANKTLQRAKQALGVTSRRWKNKQGEQHWLWTMPAVVPQDQ